MIVDAQCKFCQKPLKLSVDEAYAEMGDPFKLMALASCNRCADYHVARRQLFERVKVISMKLFGGAVEKDDLPKTREALTALIKRYMRLLAEHRNLNMPDWDDGIVDDILTKPGNYALVLDQVPRMFAQPSLV